MHIIGIFAVTASLMVVMIGLPHQIYMNYRRKSCEGIAPSLICSACCTYTLWGLYGWTKPDYFLVISQVPGSILAFTLLFQIFYYKKGSARR